MALSGSVSIMNNTTIKVTVSGTAGSSSTSSKWTKVRLSVTCSGISTQTQTISRTSSGQVSSTSFYFNGKEFTNYNISGSWVYYDGTNTGTGTYDISMSPSSITTSGTIKSYTVTCYDYVGSTLLGTAGSKTYTSGQTASGSDWGSSTTTGAYYPNYMYDTCTSVTVTGTTTVYRYFKENTFRLILYNGNEAQLGSALHNSTASLGNIICTTPNIKIGVKGNSNTSYTYTLYSCTVVSNGKTIYTHTGYDTNDTEVTTLPRSNESNIVLTEDASFSITLTYSNNNSSSGTNSNAFTSTITGYLYALDEEADISLVNSSATVGTFTIKPDKARSYARTVNVTATDDNKGTINKSYTIPANSTATITEAVTFNMNLKYSINVTVLNSLGGGMTYLFSRPIQSFTMSSPNIEEPELWNDGSYEVFMSATASGSIKRDYSLTTYLYLSPYSFSLYNTLIASETFSLGAYYIVDINYRTTAAAGPSFGINWCQKNKIYYATLAVKDDSGNILSSVTGFYYIVDGQPNVVASSGTTGSITVTASIPTTSGVTVKNSSINILLYSTIRDASTGYYRNDDYTDSYNIYNVSSITHTFTDLPLGVTYYIEVTSSFTIEITVDGETKTKEAGSDKTVSATPKVFSWTSQIGKDLEYGITAEEWNDFTLHLSNKVKLLKIPYIISQAIVYPNDTFTADIFKNRAQVANDIVPYVAYSSTLPVNSINRGSPVKAEYFTTLAAILNSEVNKWPNK